MGCSKEVHPMSNAIKVTRILAHEEAEPSSDPLIKRPQFKLKKNLGPDFGPKPHGGQVH